MIHESKLQRDTVFSLSGSNGMIQQRRSDRAKVVRSMWISKLVEARDYDDDGNGADDGNACSCSPLSSLLRKKYDAPPSNMMIGWADHSRVPERQQQEFIADTPTKTPDCGVSPTIELDNTDLDRSVSGARNLAHSLPLANPRSRRTDNDPETRCRAALKEKGYMAPRSSEMRHQRPVFSNH